MKNSYVEIRGVRLGEGRPKLCVPIVGRIEEEIYAQAKVLKESPAQLAEWRADWFTGLCDPKRLQTVLESLRQIWGEGPLLFTIRTAKEGGEQELSWEEYRRVNLQAARSGCVDLIDVELFRMPVGQAEELLGQEAGGLTGKPQDLSESLSDLLPGQETTKLSGKPQSLSESLSEVHTGESLASCLQREGVQTLIHDLQEAGVRVIGSSHDFSRTPGEAFLVRCLCAMQELGADICKLAVMPREEADVLHLLQATWQMKSRFKDRPLITMSMGRLGVLSRLAGELYGSDLTFGTVGQASAPGQIGAGQLSDILDLLHGEEEEAAAPQDREISGSENREAGTAISKDLGHIFLIGFMGAGKSTVALRLQKLLDRERIEMDAGIEQQEGQRITELFAQYGEEYFRDKETAFLRSLKAKAPAVVSCGGGVVVRQENTDFMKGCGRIVLLTARPQTILERVQGSQERPILNGNMNVEFIGQLIEKRRELYEAAADLIVATDGKTVDAICREILEGLQGR